MNDEPSIGQVIFDLAKHEDDTFGQRTDWLLIFHAILLEAFFFSTPSFPTGAGAVSLFGLLTGYLWLVTGIRQWWGHKDTWRSLQDSEVVGEDLAIVFQGVSDTRRERQPSWYAWARATPAFAVLIPGSVFLQEFWGQTP
ncbi:MAG TPA: hypothetical protein VGL91_23870 [Acidobacteriota bacterium]|jgi:hypothetical protein